MHFASWTFVLFVSLTLCGWRLCVQAGQKTGAKLVLLAASYVFYGSWSLQYLPLLWLSTVVDGYVARRIYLEYQGRAAQGIATRRRARAWLCVSLGVNLGLLGYYKYANFIVAQWQPDAVPVVVEVPFGISFFTFQTLSYTIDVYRRKIVGVPRMIDVALYVGFFPQLMAGPIVRASAFLPQLRRLQGPNITQCCRAMYLIIVGLVQKAVISDQFLGPVVDLAYQPGNAPHVVDAWLACLLFLAQLYCDFAGYSLIALGGAQLFGLKLPLNFRAPFSAISMHDFWRRWHMSLSTWFRDYVYLPMGGRRRAPWRNGVHLVLVMTLCGIWHGAGWTFIIWGALHGAILLLEACWPRSWRGSKLWRGRSAWPQAVAVYVMMSHTCILVRASDLGQALDLLRAMYGASGGLRRVDLLSGGLALAILLLMLSFQWYNRRAQRVDWWLRLPVAPRVLMMVAMLLLLWGFAGTSEQFYYFRF